MLRITSHSKSVNITIRLRYFTIMQVKGGTKKILVRSLKHLFFCLPVPILKIVMLLALIHPCLGAPAKHISPVETQMDKNFKFGQIRTHPRVLRQWMCL